MLIIPNISRIPFYLIIIEVAILFLLFNTDNSIIKSPTKIRELYVNSTYGKQAGFKSLSQIKSMDIQRKVFINPFSKERFWAWYIYNNIWTDIELYAEKYKKGDDIDDLLLMHANHLLEEKSIESVENIIIKRYCSSGIKESRDLLKSYGLIKKKTVHHRHERKDMDFTKDNEFILNNE